MSIGPRTPSMVGLLWNLEPCPVSISTTLAVSAEGQAGCVGRILTAVSANSLFLAVVAFVVVCRRRRRPSLAAALRLLLSSSSSSALLLICPSIDRRPPATLPPAARLLLLLLRFLQFHFHLRNRFGSVCTDAGCCGPSERT
eukprot:9474967-Pyramimonas_sp.AAC.2